MCKILRDRLALEKELLADLDFSNPHSQVIDEAAEEAQLLIELNAIGNEPETPNQLEAQNLPEPCEDNSEECAGPEPVVTAEASEVITETTSIDVVSPASPDMETPPDREGGLAPRQHQLPIPDGYAQFPDGLYELPADETSAPIFICSPLRVEARYSDLQGRGWGTLISVVDAQGQWHQIPIAKAELQRRPGEVIATLVDRGLELAVDKKTSDRLLRFLKASRPVEHLSSVDRMGWVGDAHSAFVIGEDLIGRSDILALPPATGIGQGLVIHGDVPDWKEHVGLKCQGNPLMILAVSLAFSGPLLAPLKISGGGLHFRGASSSGKTTLLNLAASVWGGHQLITQWRATSNGLEAIAVTLNGMLLPLDEIAEISARELHSAIYMLANGTGKARMTKDVTLADQARWRLALISSGEISVADKLREARLDAMAGHQVRLIDIEADGRTYGAFDDLHGVGEPAAFAEIIQQVVQDHHGAVGREFVRMLIARGATAPLDDLKAAVQSHASSWIKSLPSAPDGQISRVATRFAVIGVAGDLATSFGLTGWQDGEAVAAAGRAFADWYDRHYGARRDAVDAFVKPLQDFLAANLNALSMIGDQYAEGDEPEGWRDASRVYLPTATWSRLFPATESVAAAKALLDMQMLVPGEEGRLSRKAPRAIPGRQRVYTLNTDRVMAYKAA